MCGLAYFTDGHTEEILNYLERRNHYVIFCTETGLYKYEEYSEPSYEARGLRELITFRTKDYCFYKHDYGIGTFPCCWNVDKRSDYWHPINIYKIELIDG